MEKYSELTKTLLENRGIKDPESAEIFLNPSYERDMHDPFLMRDMERACGRIFQAIKEGQRIVVYSDYDADGIPGAVILHDFFKKVGYENFEVYIPHRYDEGYGLNIEAIEEFREKGTKLIITIDLGITALEEVALANSYEIDVIITDHHLPVRSLGEGGFATLNLPEAYAILNPKVDEYPEKMLCGSGVAFKLVQGFVKKYKEKIDLNHGWEKWLLDMAGLATLSDMVPLLGENRAIAYFGMKVLQKSPRPGLQKLLAKINIDQRYLTEDDVGFMVTPRINAASRLDNPMRAYELLSTSDAAEAGSLAEHLTNINNDRKTTVATIMKNVKKTLEKRELREVIVVGHPEWKLGVLGLVAGKIMDEYERTVFVWGKDENDTIKGSCRSPGEVSVVELMTATRESFVDFGGHELAGGFTVVSEKIHFLEDALVESHAKVQKKISGDEEMPYDLSADFSIVNMKSYKEIERLAPFGMGNPKPVFLFEKVKVTGLRKFGKNGSGEHLSITFADSTGKSVEAISFFSNEDSFKTHLFEGAYVDVYGSLDLSRFRGRPELRLRIIDII